MLEILAFSYTGRRRDKFDSLSRRFRLGLLLCFRKLLLRGLQFLHISPFRKDWWYRDIVR